MHIPNHSVKREKMLRESDGGLGETDFFVKSFKGSSTMKRLFLLQIFIVVVNTTSETLRRQPSSSLREKQAMPCHAMPCHTIPRHSIPRHATPRRATPCHATPRHGADVEKQVICPLSVTFRYYGVINLASERQVYRQREEGHSGVVRPGQARPGQARPGQVWRGLAWLNVAWRGVGLYTLEDQLHDHEIVIPRKVSHKGELISHNVSHHHDEDGTEVHYRLSIAGKEYHIELTAAKDFIGPSMIVERHKRDFHIRSPPKSRSSKCHYRGFIRDHPNSRVALSACDGLCLDMWLDQSPTATKILRSN
uniref:Peptidase M12B propeptide domain-containing protein n=1 Tax=Vespula pensylvanica TaxID=30213 RepID=A0A834K483_VESPE|nr:hypothetical protein H0235_016528 [Vespula pensylvanica]